MTGDELEVLDKGLRAIERKYPGGLSGDCAVWAVNLRRELGPGAKFIVAVMQWPGELKIENHVGVLYHGHVLDADGVSTLSEWRKRWASHRFADVEIMPATTPEAQILEFGMAPETCPPNVPSAIRKLVRVRPHRRRR